MATTVTYMGSSDTVAVVNNSYYLAVTDGSSWSGGLICREISAGAGMPMIETRTYQRINEKEEVRDMRGLFQFYVVDPEKGGVVGDGLVIAKNKETAKIKALAPFADKYDLDDLDIICNRLGDVREKKEVQEVKIVK